jgi:hypothetical protein
MNNPFHPNRLTKGNCSFCKFAIEIYEDVYYDKDNAHMHKECLNQKNYECNVLLNPKSKD